MIGSRDHNSDSSTFQGTHMRTKLCTCYRYVEGLGLSPACSVVGCPVCLALNMPQYPAGGSLSGDNFVISMGRQLIGLMKSPSFLLKSCHGTRGGHFSLYILTGRNLSWGYGHRLPMYSPVLQLQLGNKDAPNTTVHISILIPTHLLPLSPQN